MGVKYKTEFDLTDDMSSTAKALAKRKVNVGVIGDKGEHQWLAAIHEYGCKIPVTDKMRGYLHGKLGVHLKASTKYIVIPERSFLRAGYDKNRDDILDWADEQLPDVMAGTMPIEKYLEGIGLPLATAIRDYIKFDVGPPKNMSWPTADPTKTETLRVSGDMIKDLTYEIVKG